MMTMRTTASASRKQGIFRPSPVPLWVWVLGGLLCFTADVRAEGEQTDEAVVLEPKVEGELTRAERARLDAAVTRALDEAQLQVVPPPNRDAILAGEPELHDCSSAECQDRIGRLLSAKAVLTQKWQVRRDGAPPSAAAEEPPPAGVVVTATPDKGKRGKGKDRPAAVKPIGLGDPPAAKVVSGTEVKGWWRFTVSMFNVQIGAVGVQESLECNKCNLEQAAQSLGDLAKKVVLLEPAQGRGTIEVSSTPSADVYVDSRKLGFTPYKRQAYAGKHEITVTRTGYKSYHSTINVEEGKKFVVQAALTQGSDREFRQERGPRPRWRLIAGAGAIVGGALMLGFGGSALSVNGKCVQDGPDNMCVRETSADGMSIERRVNTTGVGAGLVAAGAVLAAGGVVLIALPGEKRVVEVAASPISGGAALRLAGTF